MASVVEVSLPAAVLSSGVPQTSRGRRSSERGSLPVIRKGCVPQKPGVRVRQSGGSVVLVVVEVVVLVVLVVVLVVLVVVLVVLVVVLVVLLVVVVVVSTV
jgi:hypothetical protein